MMLTDQGGCADITLWGTNPQTTVGIFFELNRGLVAGSSPDVASAHAVYGKDRALVRFAEPEGTAAALRAAEELRRLEKELAAAERIGGRWCRKANVARDALKQLVGENPRIRPEGTGIRQYIKGAIRHPRYPKTQPT